MASVYRDAAHQQRVRNWCLERLGEWDVPHLRHEVPTTAGVARRPGGIVAGALQYRHQCIQMFEGYSGFRDEVEAEEALARGQLLADMGTDGDRLSLTGPAGAEAEARLAEFARHAVFDGQVVTDEVRLRRIVTRHDPHLYPGTFLTRVYNPERALCRTPSGSTETPEADGSRAIPFARPGNVLIQSRRAGT
ncbi:hypothetical protein WBG99_00150 [Streptomyces sp. TG1A-60]|uniref:hypothetical protein n=1 Tax=Streptomyces sp. TG1A-60 TaxID=3129111 RepID=UPI0030D0269F